MANDWTYRLKRRLLLGVFGLLAVLVAATVLLTSVVLRRDILAESGALTGELGHAVSTCLDVQMMSRDPDQIQRVMGDLSGPDGALARAFIVDRQGRVAYSSDPRDVGRVLRNDRDSSCTPCHAGTATPERVTSTFERGGESFHRHVTVLRNEQRCQGCHPAAEPVIGKIVIDRSLESTDALLSNLQLVLLGGGVVFLLAILLAAPFASRGMNRYIGQIEQQDSEITLLYRIVEHLSQTIDLRELRGIILHTVRDTFDADEVLMALSLGDGERRCGVVRRGEGGVTRRGVEEDPRLAELHARWLAGSLPEVALSPDRREIAVPIRHDGERLGLIVIRRAGRPFEESKSRLVRALGSHVAIALQNARLYVIATTDELTRLHTSRHLRTCLDAHVNRFETYGEKFALLFLDIDDFKKVNDTHGHVVGDDVLRQMGATILGGLGDDDLAFRYGGEELVVLLPHTDAGGAVRVGERLRERIAALRGREWPAGLHVTVSVGAAACPTSGTTARALIQRADEALYRAKRSGKNRVVAAAAARPPEEDQSPAVAAAG